MAILARSLSRPLRESGYEAYQSGIQDCPNPAGYPPDEILGTEGIIFSEIPHPLGVAFKIDNGEDWGWIDFAGGPTGPPDMVRLKSSDGLITYGAGKRIKS